MATMQSAHTSSNPFGPTSASSNGASGYEGSAFGQHQNGFRSQEFGSQATGTVHRAQLAPWCGEGNSSWSTVSLAETAVLLAWRDRRCCIAGAWHSQSCSCGGESIGSIGILLLPQAHLSSRRAVTFRQSPALEGRSVRPAALQQGLVG